MNIILPTLYIFGLYGAFLGGSFLLRTHSSASKARFPQLTLLLTIAIAIPSILQFFFPMILSIFQRDYRLFLSGDWWRVITPLFVQDGGVAGTIFNVVSLLLLGSIAEQLWGSKSMIMIFFIGGIVGEIIAFAWQPIGAGNSIGNFSLAASIAVACLRRHPSRIIKVIAIFTFCIYGVLLGLRDIHGAAATVGVIVAFALSQMRHNEYNTL